MEEGVKFSEISSEFGCVLGTSTELKAVAINKRKHKNVNSVNILSSLGVIILITSGNGWVRMHSGSHILSQIRQRIRMHLLSQYLNELWWELANHTFRWKHSHSAVAQPLMRSYYPNQFDRSCRCGRNTEEVHPETSRIQWNSGLE